jgi:crotonobetainyl-CoA:carnitine CoA-transferase CaiB-like acyl-CoA transferase
LGRRKDSVLINGEPRAFLMREQRTENEQAIRPLDGIRVLEYGIFHAGPGASAILGDLGAEVIKVESGEGDPERTWTKIWQLDLSLPTGESLMFHASNRNKKGVYLDIETEGGARSSIN